VGPPGTLAQAESRLREVINISILNMENFTRDMVVTCFQF
jgi:hypothetical protein